MLLPRVRYSICTATLVVQGYRFKKIEIETDIGVNLVSNRERTV